MQSKFEEFEFEEKAFSLFHTFLLEKSGRKISGKGIRLFLYDYQYVTRMNADRQKDSMKYPSEPLNTTVDEIQL